MFLTPMSRRVRKNHGLGTSSVACQGKSGHWYLTTPFKWIGQTTSFLKLIFGQQNWNLGTHVRVFVPLHLTSCAYLPTRLAAGVHIRSWSRTGVCMQLKVSPFVTPRDVNFCQGTRKVMLWFNCLTTTCLAVLLNERDGSRTREAETQETNRTPRKWNWRSLFNNL